MGKMLTKMGLLSDSEEMKCYCDYMECLQSCVTHINSIYNIFILVRNMLMCMLCCAESLCKFKQINVIDSQAWEDGSFIFQIDH